MLKNLNEYCIKSNSTFLETLKKIDKSSVQCLIVTNKSEKILGTISDGDIRRSLLKGNKLTSKINKSFNKKFFYLKENSFYDKRKFLGDPDKKIIPIINKKKKLIDVIVNLKSHKYFKFNENVEVVIMAGGIGTRLAPLTNILPKPLIPYKEKSLIEHIIENFINYKLNKFYISINYKNVLIKSFFNELKPKYKIKFLNENKPLGTAGILEKLKKLKKTLVISNCDTLLDIDIESLIKYHKENNHDITVVAANQYFKIPYGVCKIDKNKLKTIIEKPETSFLANTGVYVVNSKVLSLIPKNTFFSFVDLINKSIKNHKKIGVYPINPESWKDLGQLNSLDNK